MIVTEEAATISPWSERLSRVCRQRLSILERGVISQAQREIALSLCPSGCCLLCVECALAACLHHGKAAPQLPPRDNRPALPSLLLLLSAAC